MYHTLGLGREPHAFFFRSDMYIWNFLSYAILITCEQIELEATSQYPGTPLRAPTTESGFAPACKDTCWGDLKLKMWERRFDGSKGKVCFVPLDHIIYQCSPCFIKQINNCLM